MSKVMPKAVYYTKEKITKAVIDLIRKNGSESLTSRSIGKKLGGGKDILGLSGRFSEL